jgi:hypothetical protein
VLSLGLAERRVGSDEASGKRTRLSPTLHRVAFGCDTGLEARRFMTGVAFDDGDAACALHCCTKATRDASAPRCSTPPLWRAL